MRTGHPVFRRNVRRAVSISLFIFKDAPCNDGRKGCFCSLLKPGRGTDIIKGLFLLLFMILFVNKAVIFTRLASKFENWNY